VKLCESCLVSESGTAHAISNGTSTTLANGTTADKAHSLPVRYLTILPHAVDNTWRYLGFEAAGIQSGRGAVVYETDSGAAGRRYGISGEDGAVFVVRPDGWIGARVELGTESGKAEKAARYVAAYLRSMLV
jgi:hypothetical protein